MQFEEISGKVWIFRIFFKKWKKNSGTKIEISSIISENVKNKQKISILSFIKAILEKYRWKLLAMRDRFNFLMEFRIFF